MRQLTSTVEDLRMSLLTGSAQARSWFGVEGTVKADKAVHKLGGRPGVLGRVRRSSTSTSTSTGTGTSTSTGSTGSTGSSTGSTRTRTRTRLALHWASLRIHAVLFMEVNVRRVSVPGPRSFRIAK